MALSLVHTNMHRQQCSAVAVCCMEGEAGTANHMYSIYAHPLHCLFDPLLCCSFSSRGYYLDGSAIFGSLVLLVLLLALTFERILGLDRWVNQALQ